MDKVYKEHPVFNQLAEYAEFYKDLAFIVMGWVTMGTMGSVFNIDTYVYSSIQGTLESIKDVLIRGRVNDAYALFAFEYLHLPSAAIVSRLAWNKPIRIFIAFRCPAF